MSTSMKLNMYMVGYVDQMKTHVSPIGSIILHTGIIALPPPTHFIWFDICLSNIRIFRLEVMISNTRVDLCIKSVKGLEPTLTVFYIFYSFNTCMHL